MGKKGRNGEEPKHSAITGQVPRRLTFPKSYSGALVTMLITLESCLPRGTRELEHFYSHTSQLLVKHFLAGKGEGDSEFPCTSGKAGLAAWVLKIDTGDCWKWKHISIWFKWWKHKSNTIILGDLCKALATPQYIAKKKKRLCFFGECKCT